MKKADEKTSEKSEGKKANENIDKLNNYQTKQLLAESSKLKDLSGFAFVMAIADVKRRITTEQKVLDELHEPSDAIKEYQKELGELNKKFSVKDDNGEPRIITETRGGQQLSYYDLDKDLIDDRKKEVEKLEKKYKKDLDEQKEKDERYDAAMKEYSTYKKAPLSEKQIPKNITLEQLELANYFIKITS